MKIVKKFEISVSIDTQKANINADKGGESYDWDAYPNWEFNYAGEEAMFIENCLQEFSKNFSYTGLSSKIREI